MIKMSESAAIDGFVVIKVKFDDQSKVIRHLFVKEHKVRDKNKGKPEGKTLFMVNIPPFVDSNCLKHLFGKCGKIVNIWFHSTPTSSLPETSKSKFFDKREQQIDGYKVAYVVFSKESSLRNALSLSKSSQVFTLKPNTDQFLVGIKAYKRDYNQSIVNRDEMQKEIDEFMSDYDKRVETEKQRVKENEGKADEEGWVQVRRRTNRKHLPNSEANDDKIVAKQKRRKKSKANNFYSFQLRESKIEQLALLRKKFEEDKKRIAIMKASRKFKPF